MQLKNKGEKRGEKRIGEGERRNTVDVSGISKALYKFQLQQETLAPIIWIFIHILRPETQPILFPPKKLQYFNYRENAREIG